MSPLLAAATGVVTSTSTATVTGPASKTGTVTRTTSSSATSTRTASIVSTVCGLPLLSAVSLTRALVLQCGTLGARNILSIRLSISAQYLSNAFASGFDGVVYSLAAASVNSLPTYTTTTTGLTLYGGCPSTTIFYNSNAQSVSWIVGATSGACVTKPPLFQLSSGSILMKTSSWVPVGTYGVVCGTATATRSGE